MDDALDRLAAAARRLYVFHYRTAEERRTGARSCYGSRPMPQWDGGVDRGGRTHKAVWPKIARAALAQGADLADYVAAQFVGAVDPPRPNQLLSAAALARYHSYRGDSARAAALELEVQRNQFAFAIARNGPMCRGDLGAAARIALRDPTAALSALFRYCVARQTHENEIAAEFYDRAVGQYLAGAAGYRTGWAPALPGDLIGDAEAIMAKLLGGR